MTAPPLPPLIADRHPHSLARIISAPDVDDIEFINATTAQTYLERFVVRAPLHRRLWGWRVIEGGKP